MKKIAVVGGANVDIMAQSENKIVPHDSNPGRVAITFGGVGRNIAHNLRLLGHDVSLISVFGDDMPGGFLMEHCRGLGMDLHLSQRLPGARSNFYVCLSDFDGEMVNAVSDMTLMERLTPQFLLEKTVEINTHDAMAVDANLTAESLGCLFRRVSVPVFADAVSSAKAVRISQALDESRTELFLLKANRLEARVMTGSDDLHGMVSRLHAMGVVHVVITMGADGVLHSGPDGETFVPGVPVDVVNTTGAGDALLAGTVSGYVEGLTIQSALRVGVEAASQTLVVESAVNPDLSLNLSI